jgi:hypothetical protein
LNKRRKVHAVILRADVSRVVPLQLLLGRQAMFQAMFQAIFQATLTSQWHHI